MGKGSPPPAPESQNINQSNLPAYAEPYLTDIMQRAQAESYRPYQEVQDPREVAGFTQGHKLGSTTRNSGMQQRPEFQEAAGMTRTGAQQATGFGQTGAGLGAIAAVREQQNYQNLATSPAGATSVYVSVYAKCSGCTKTRSRYETHK